ncbi:hypothetical protein FQZ97_1002980 [compost metagenome]
MKSGEARPQANASAGTKIQPSLMGTSGPGLAKASGRQWNSQATSAQVSASRRSLCSNSGHSPCNAAIAADFLQAEG